MNETKIIGVSENSGSGKSTLSERLQQELNSTQVAWDDFPLDQRIMLIGSNERAAMMNGTIQS
jgi:uridine kinase